MDHFQADGGITPPTGAENVNRSDKFDAETQSNASDAQITVEFAGFCVLICIAYCFPARLRRELDKR